MFFPLLILTTTQILPTTAVVNCRIACGRCEDRNDPAELLEVYCSMCEECIERREEWLEGENRRINNERIDRESRRSQTDIGPKMYNTQSYPFRPERREEWPEEENRRIRNERMDRDSRRSRTDISYKLYNKQNYAYRPERREEWPEERNRRITNEKMDRHSRRSRTDKGFKVYNRQNYPFRPVADNCIPPPDDRCQQPLTYFSKHESEDSEETTTTTTTKTITTTTPTTITTTATTNRPCIENNNPCREPMCPFIPCIPMMPMCPSMCPPNFLGSTKSTMREKKLLEMKKTTNMDSLYFYLGVPKKMFNDLKIVKS